MRKYCNGCGGSGKVPKIAIGLGQHGLVPAYTMQKCDVCDGTGYLEVMAANGILMPFSFVERWLRDKKS